MRSPAILIGLSAALLLSACATPPKPLQGEFVSSDPRDGVEAQQQPVRWGGTILATEPMASETCFQILGQRLNAAARPTPSDDPRGRFLACKDGFYDPAVFSPGRELTVVGRVDGQEPRQVGDYTYLLPRVQVETLFLWSERLPEHRLQTYRVVYPLRHSPYLIFDYGYIQRPPRRARPH